MILLFRLSVIAFGISLSSCATVRDNYVPVTEQISVPALGEKTTVALGEEMLQQGTATSTKGVLLQQTNNVRGFVLSPGFYPQKGQDDEYVFTSFSFGNAAPGIGTLSMEGGILAPNVLPQGLRFHRTKQETCVIAPNGYGVLMPFCDTEYSFQFTERPFVSENDFQQTLIYSGRVGDKIRISYREFSGNRARSAFTNEAEYDLSTSNEIGYRGARIRVLEANNQEITYEVLSNFN